MAKRKQEAALYIEVETQEEWEDLLSKEGLTLIDVYADWCGPCKAMSAILRRIKNELGDELLRFAMAKSDTIDALEKYRNKSQPCFLFFAGGSLVAVIRGANCPLIVRTIQEQLAAEHKVIDGTTERKPIYDPVIGKPLSQQAKPMTVEVQKEKEVTLAIIKPDAVRNGKVDDILQQLNEAGIEVIHEEDRSLTDAEAREFYSHLENETYFEDYIKFMTSGPSHVLVLTQGETGENVIKNFRDLLGPTSVEVAKTEAPTSLRAKYGSDKYMNALHGSDSRQTAAREMAFFFPDFETPKYAIHKTRSVENLTGLESKPKKLQRTLALIRPTSLEDHYEDIIAKIKEAGFEVAFYKEIQLSREQAEDFYKEHQGQEYFDEIVTTMCSGPLLALGLAREDAVNKWRDIFYPTKKDDEAGKRHSKSSILSIENIIPIHASPNPNTAKAELQYFFPIQKTVAAIKPDAIGTKDEIISKIHDAGFRIAARKETQLSREMAQQLYQGQRGTDYFEDLVDNMTSGDTYFMVLTREDAVDGWRKLLGPTDPSVAKTEDPSTIRAMFGTDLVHNAAHGSHSVDDVSKTIQQIFGDVDIQLESETKEHEEEPRTEQITKDEMETDIPKDVVNREEDQIQPDLTEQLLADVPLEEEKPKEDEIPKEEKDTKQEEQNELQDRRLSAEQETGRGDPEGNDIKEDKIDIEKERRGSKEEIGIKEENVPPQEGVVGDTVEQSRLKEENLDDEIEKTSANIEHSRPKEENVDDKEEKESAKVDQGDLNQHNAHMSGRQSVDALQSARTDQSDEKQEVGSRKSSQHFAETKKDEKQNENDDGTFSSKQTVEDNVQDDPQIKNEQNNKEADDYKKDSARAETDPSVAQDKQPDNAEEIREEPPPPAEPVEIG